MSIFKKIIGSFLLVSVVPIVLFGVLIVNKVFNVVREEVFKNNLYVSRQISSQIDSYFGTIQKSLESLSSLPEIKNFNKDRVDELLRSYYRNYTIYYGYQTIFEADPFESFIILDDKGTVRTVYPFQESHLGLSYYDQPFFQEVVGKKKAYLSADVVVSALTGEPIVKMAVPVLDKDGKILSVIEANVKLESIIQLTSQVKIGETGYLFTLNKEGVIVTYPNERLILEHQNIEDISPGLLSQFSQKSSSGQLIFYPQKNPDTVLAYSFPKTIDWIVVVSQSLFEALAVPLSIKIHFILILCLVIIFVGIIAFYLSRGITVPLGKLTKQVLNIGDRQDLTAEINIKTSDEIEDLASSFNQMMRRLRARTMELENKTKELQRRKEELEKKNREIQKRKDDLERFYKLTVGRELRMIELKKKIKELEKKLNG